MIIRVGSLQIDTRRVRERVNSPLGRRVALTGATVGLLLLSWSAYWVYGRAFGAVRGVYAEVVLYTSADEALARKVARRFEERSGLRVKLVTDTEATKTTGLVERLIGEKDRPRADVWWSNEIAGTIRLSRAGVLSAWTSAAGADVPGGWPTWLTSKDSTWHGFALRSRVIAFNTNTVTKSQAPTKLRDLTRERWRGRVGMARPEFGTTRNQLGYLVSAHGEGAVREWLIALRDNGLVLYNGNAAVVQGLAVGEIDVGLTDTDDVWLARKAGKPVDLVYETADGPRERFTGLPSAGALLIPNTLGRVRAGPNGQNGARLAEFLMSAEVEELLALDESRHVPVREAVAKKVGASRPARAAAADYEAAAGADPIAMKLVSEVFGK